MESRSTPFLELHDAVVRRAGRDILTVGAFALEEGESIALLGPNGAGKSTFVQLITRDVMPLHREEAPVVFRGNSRATLADVKQAVGYVSASMQKQIHVHLPALDIVEGGFFGALGVPKRFKVTDAQCEKALDVMEELGISDLAGRDATTLSSGQARRVLIARALVNDPDALVMDEPTTGLDPEGMFYVRRAMRHLAQTGRAIVLVTHYLEDVIPEIDRVALVKDGKIDFDGSKEEAFSPEKISSLFDLPSQAINIIKNNNYYIMSQTY